MRGYRADRAFEGTRVRPDGALVLVDDGRIVGIEPASAPAPDGCEVVHLPGTTLLPGLIDTHVHLCGDSGPRALDQVPELSAGELARVITTAERQHLRAGVTTMRDLGDHRWAVLDRIASDGSGSADPSADDVRPRVVGSGPPITSPGGHCWSMGGEASGEEDLRRAVRERAERGAAVVKIMASGGVMTPGTDMLSGQFTLAQLRAVVEEAHRLGLPVTAHAHALPAVEASAAAGVDGIEHCSCLTATGSRRPPELLARLAAAGTYVCPTLGRVPGLDPPARVQAALEAVHGTYEQHLPHVARLRRAGTVLLAGTDAGIGPSKAHGLVPWAIADLVAACGMTPAEALASATALAARACGLEGRTGRLAVGLEADLLMVDGDALADATAVQRPRLVVSRGREVPIAQTA
jgi:imidazolonepropionase-like amidohydrolase